MTLKETIEFTTPNGHEVVLRGYITGRIKQAVENVLMGTAEIKASGETSFKATAALEAGNEAMRQIVISVDGKSENVLEAILDLPEPDYDMVKVEVEKVQRPLPTRSDVSSPTTSSTI